MRVARFPFELKRMAADQNEPMLAHADQRLPMLLAKTPR